MVTGLSEDTIEERRYNQEIGDSQRNGCLKIGHALKRPCQCHGSVRQQSRTKMRPRLGIRK